MDLTWGGKTYSFKWSDDAKYIYDELKSYVPFYKDDDTNISKILNGNDTSAVISESQKDEANIAKYTLGESAVAVANDVKDWVRKTVLRDDSVVPDSTGQSAASGFKVKHIALIGLVGFLGYKVFK